MRRDLVEGQHTVTVKHQETEPAAGGVLGVRRLMYGELEHIGDDLRPQVRFGAAAVEVKMREASLGESLDRVAKPAKVEGDTFENRAAQVRAGRFEGQVQKTAPHLAVFGW